MSTDINSPFTLLDRIAKSLAVDPSFIEKDWYAMRLISTLMEVQDSHFQLVFSGGTSLSKGFGLIQRFSEDLDFKVLMLQPNTTRKDRQNFREQLLATIEANDVIWTVDRQSLQSGNRSGFFKIPISYQPQYIIAPVLRPYIQIEVTFEPPVLQPESRFLQSFVSAAQKGDPEVHNILCVSPLETAADKLSSLSWRVLDRDRSSLGDDPTLVRHLHDLAILAPSILGQNENALQTLALQILKKDTSRAKPDTASLIISDRLQRMVDILKTDIVYETEYHNFVTGMSYARDEERIPYKKALESLQTLTSFLLQENSSNENLKATIDSTLPSNSVQASIDSLHQSLNDLKNATQRFSNALDTASTRNIDLSTDPPAASPTQNAKPDSNRQNEADLTTDANPPTQDIQNSSPQVKTKPQLER